MKDTTTSKKSRKQKVHVDDAFELINPNAAGLDIGAREIYACVPAGRDTEQIRRFGTCTPDLKELAQWLKKCRVTSVAMEATGIYWKAPFKLLVREGLDCLLVNARDVKNVSGRKTDVQDCAWIQKLHTVGLLRGSFQPGDPYCVLRAYTRYRDELLSGRSTQILLMQKALLEMNLQLPQVLSDITGASGMNIITAILNGERDPVKLANMVDKRVKASTDKIAKALSGDYREEFLFQLKSAMEMYLKYEEQYEQCCTRVLAALEALPDKVDIHEKPLPAKLDPKKKIPEEVRLGFYQKLGVDITQVEGLGPQIGLTIIAELGADLGKSFKTEKNFTSFLGLCPNTKISGGKVLSSKSRKVAHRVSSALRMAATTLKNSQTALGAYYRKQVARLGKAQGITATAHKLARIVYHLLTKGDTYVRQGLEDYEKKYKEQTIKNLKRKAEKLGFVILPTATTQPVPKGVS